MSGEKSPLERILEIDKEINLIKNDITYMKIRNGLKKINGFHQGNRIISVPSPQNTRNEIRVRRRSKRIRRAPRPDQEYPFQERRSEGCEDAEIVPDRLRRQRAQRAKRHLRERAHQRQARRQAAGRKLHHRERNGHSLRTVSGP